MRIQTHVVDGFPLSFSCHMSICLVNMQRGNGHPLKLGQGRKGSLRPAAFPHYTSEYFMYEENP